MRLFVALDIDESIREKIVGFIEGVREFAADVRWVKIESLHVTLKFIGETSKPDEIEHALSQIQATPIEMRFRGYGFFPTSKAPRVFWIGIVAGPELGTLANSVDETTAALGVPREEHAFNPHLTMARRGSSGAPHRLKGDGINPAFRRLQEKLAAMSPLDFGTMTAREFFLYRSQPMRGGARYTKIARFGLT